MDEAYAENEAVFHCEGQKDGAFAVFQLQAQLAARRPGGGRRAARRHDQERQRKQKQGRAEKHSHPLSRVRREAAHSFAAGFPVRDIPKTETRPTLPVP
jgi:hypothetical protein